MIHEPQKLYDALAITGTNAYKSPVVSRTRFCNTRFAGAATSTATGVLAVWENFLNDRDYRTACGVAAGSTDAPTAAQEAANDTGWVPVLVYYKVAGVETTTGTIAIGAAGTFNFTIKKGPMRVRLIYTNATNSGTLSATANSNEAS